MKLCKFLNLVSIPQLAEDQSKDYEFILSEKNLLVDLKSMPYNKFPGNDGLTKEFYEVFWEDHKTHLDQVLNQHLIKANSVIPRSKR